MTDQVLMNLAGKDIWCMVQIILQCTPSKTLYNNFYYFNFLLRFFIHDADQDKELLLGHVSMVLDMVRD